MRLQSDPTVMYGLGKNSTEAITHKDLLTVTPYNSIDSSAFPCSHYHARFSIA